MGCPIVTLELLYDARESEEIEVVARALVALPQAQSRERSRTPESGQCASSPIRGQPDGIASECRMP